jgi:antitoxin component of RelBE/YafQ-DinJ toxin-antitoxin module
MEEDVKISAPKPRALNATTVSAIEETEAGTGLRREKDLNKFLAELKE